MKTHRLLSSLVLLSLVSFAQTIPDFTAANVIPAGTGVSNTITGDFNGDGLIDLAAVDVSLLGFSISYGSPGGLYTSPVPRSVGFIPQSALALNLNNDASTDLVFIASLTIASMTTTPGTGGLSAINYIAGGHATHHFLANADFNKDGIQDLIVAGSAGFSYLRGLGNGLFANPVMLPQASPGSYILIGDFNNDGNLDFLGTAGLTSYGYLGDGTGSFAAPVATAPINYGAQLADFNSDGKLDIVHRTAQARQEGSNQAVVISLGQGDGRFIGYLNYVLATNLGNPVAGDFNADGKADVAVYDATIAGVRVFAGTGNGLLSPPVTLDGGSVSNSGLIAADLDGNGSKDLVLTAVTTHRIYRNTHGNPALLALLSASPASVVGGAATVTGTVALGGPAPGTGATVTLTVGDSSLVSFPAGNTVTIAPGASSATFAISTSAVATATTVTLTASWNGVTVTSKLDLVAAYTLTGLTANPASQYGIFTATGTIALSGAADANANVTLVSSNAALASVPVSVNVPAGSSTGTFTITLTPVTVDTPVTISASLGGITRTAALTVLRPADTVAIAKAIFTVKTLQLKIDATSTSAVATITAHNPANGALLGTLSNAGGGKYTGTVIAPATLTSVTLKSSLGGTTTGAVQLK